ncbi:MAG: LptF/LptG family permease [Pseudomonadota bacterium]
MTLLDRYIFKQFFMNLLLVLSSLVAIYLLVDFFERIDNFSAAGKPFSLALTYFLLKIPLIYDQMSPVCILLAGVVTLGLLGKNRELKSLNAGGVSLFRIVLPILAASLLFTLVTMATAQWVLPKTNTRINEIWYQEVTQQVIKGIVRKGRVFHKGEKGFYTLRRPNPQKYNFTQFIYTGWDESHRNITIFLTAHRASWSEDGGWVFRNGQIKKPRPDGDYDIEIFSRLKLDLPDTPDQFFIPKYRTAELSLFELHKNALEGIKKGNMQGIIDINRRISFIFLGVPLLLLAIPLLHSMQRKWNRDLSMTIPVSCILAFFAWAAWNAGQSLSQADYLNSFVASWSIHAILSASGIFLLWRTNRR